MKFKRTLQPYIKEDSIVFGFGNPSMENTIPNTERNRELVLSNDISDMAKPEELELFRDKGLLTTNKYDDSRYSRNINFFEWIDKSRNVDPTTYQDILNRSTVLIVGIGGMGGNIAEILVRLGVGNILLVDYDVVESSNLTRQGVFFEKDIHQKKTDTAKQYLEQISGEVTIQTIEAKISIYRGLRKNLSRL